MHTFTVTWKIRGEDMYEQQYIGVVDEIETLEYWRRVHGLTMDEVEYVKLEKNP